MNKLSTAKRAQILNMLVEGMSMRAVSRLADVSINTVTKLLVEAGFACARYHDEHVRDVKSRLVQCDEIWSFCYAKKKNVEDAKSAPDFAGDVWTWTAIDSESKLIISYLVGGRDSDYALEFMEDIAARVANRIQMTTDGHKAYMEAVEDSFAGDIDYAQLIKLYGPVSEHAQGRYSPAQCNGAYKKKMTGKPDLRYVSTSHVERMNLSIRMGNRRFTRLTNAFSKKIDNHIHMLSLYFVHYNFCRIHKSLRVTPAMEAGISDTIRDMEWIVSLIDKMNPPKKRGPYKKKND